MRENLAMALRHNSITATRALAMFDRCYPDFVTPLGSGLMDGRAVL
jgi:hypothetical protein